jgi:phage gp37-like protein
MIPLGKIEAALVATLTATLKGAGAPYAVGTIASYGGEFDSEDVGKVLSKFPALLVSFSGWEPASDQGAYKILDLRFQIFACAQSLLNEGSGRAGASGKVGAYQLVADAALVLDGSALGLDEVGVPVVQPVKIGAMQAVRNGLVQSQRLAVYALDIAFSVRVEPKPRGLPVGELLTVNVDWDIPPFDAAPETLPAAPQRDGTQTIKPRE